LPSPRPTLLPRSRRPAFAGVPRPSRVADSVSQKASKRPRMAARFVHFRIRPGALSAPIQPFSRRFCRHRMQCSIPRCSTRFPPGKLPI
jgi:hypothetical protein